MRHLAFAFLLLATLAFAGKLSPKQQALFERIGKEVICQCGCNSLLRDCPMMECMVKNNMESQMKTLIAQGKSEKEILASLKAVYGERVLAAPPKKGFFLSAWIFPFVILSLGFLYLITFLKSKKEKEKALLADRSGEIDASLKPYLDLFPD